MRLCVFFFTLMSTLVMAGEGRDQWQISDEKEKVELFKAYREWFRVVADNDDLTHDEWEEQGLFWRGIIDKAWAAEQFNCSYGGWPSVRLSNGCGIPLRVNPDYPADACPAGQMACQPLLFGSGLCVSVVSRSDRSDIYENCEGASAAAGINEEMIVNSARNSSQEIQLQSLLDFADGVCNEGAPNIKDPCSSLSQRVARLRVQSVDRLLASAGTAGDELNGCNRDGESIAPITIESSADSVPLLTPQGMIAATLSEPLQFVGRVLFSGSEEERSCVFQNSQVYIVYNYCREDGSEAPALGMKIFSRSGGMIEYYVENSEERGAISQTRREDYDRNWRTSYIPTPALNGNPSPQEISSIYEGERNFRHGYCNAGGMMNIPAGFNVGVENTSCRDIPSDVSDSWLPAARTFLADPGDQWYQLQQTMRSNVRARR